MFSSTSQTDATFNVVAYSGNTSTGTLRKHLYQNHIKDWLGECKRLDITITAQEALDAIAKHRGIKPGSQTSRPQFTSERFINALAEFIVATDQVSFKAFYFIFYIYCVIY
jgi:hypothetical protein